MPGGGLPRCYACRMCGRYVIAYGPEMLVHGFSATRVVPFPQRFNVAPQSQVPVVFETVDR